MKTSTFWSVFEKLCERANKRPNPVGKEIGVASGTIAKWKAGTIPNGETLIQIADYFDVSIDYLLGRTDIPDMVVKNENVINGVTVASPIQVIGAEKEKPLDGLTAEFLKQFRELSYSDKLEIMSIVANKYKMVK